MPYFKDSQNKLHFLDDAAYSTLLPAGCVQITDAEAEQMQAPSFASIKESKILELLIACQGQIYGGFQSPALGAAHTYPANDKDQANLSASVVASLLPNLPQDWTTPFWCKDASGVWGFKQHTAAQIQQVGIAGKGAIVAALEKNLALVAQVNAATTVAQVEAITW